MDIDSAWYLAINEFARHTAWLHDLAAAYALWAGLAVLSVMLVIGWWAARRDPESHDRISVTVLTGTATVVAVLVNQTLISPVFARPRPCRAIPEVEVLLRCATDYSMPSDHCVIAGAFAAGLWLLVRGYGAVATGLAILVAFSRVYVGVHYPLDTLMGLLFGAFVSATLVGRLRRPVSTVLAKLAETRVRGLITTTARGRNRSSRTGAVQHVIGAGATSPPLPRTNDRVSAQLPEWAKLGELTAPAHPFHRFEIGRVSPSLNAYPV